MRELYYLVMAVCMTFMRGNAVKYHGAAWPSWYYLRRWRTIPVRADVMQWRAERKWWREFLNEQEGIT